MRIFVYEHASCLHRNPPASIVAEGRAMLAAICADLSAVPGVAVHTLTDVRDKEESEFRRLATNCDFSLVIAPEFDDVLLTRCRWVLEAGGALLGPSLDAITLTADKCALADHLHANGVRTPPCWAPGKATLPPPWVCKPRFGAGSIATGIIQTADELPRFLELSQREGWHGENIVQPFIRGMPVGVSFLIGPKACLALIPTAQKQSSDGRLRYRGGHLPLPEHLANRARVLGQSAIQSVPGLFGYVGVDLVLGEAADDRVIEINPRLTTSYVGLRAFAKTNLAKTMLQVALGDPTQPIEWKAGFVRFAADGSIQREA